jgi:hypothetical protein
MYEYDSSFVYIPLADAQAYFQLPGKVNAVEVLVEDPEDISAYRPELLQKIGDMGNARLVDWQQLNSHFFNALEVERNVMFLILTLIIIVAAFNIVTGITMLVKSKGRDIAILRTIGATKAAILRIFFLSGASIGVAGTLIGFVLGLVFALNVDLIRRFLERLTGAELWSAEIRFLSRLPRRWCPPTSPGWWRWACSSPSWPRSTRPGAPPASIRSRRCAMSSGGIAPTLAAGPRRRAPRLRRRGARPRTPPCSRCAASAAASSRAASRSSR